MNLNLNVYLIRTIVSYCIIIILSQPDGQGFAFLNNPFTVRGCVLWTDVEAAVDRGLTAARVGGSRPVGWVGMVSWQTGFVRNPPQRGCGGPPGLSNLVKQGLGTS